MIEECGGVVGDAVHGQGRIGGWRIAKAAVVEAYDAMGFRPPPGRP
jgi:hypothetical protein